MSNGGKGQGGGNQQADKNTDRNTDKNTGYKPGPHDEPTPRESELLKRLQDAEQRAKQAEIERDAAVRDMSGLKIKPEAHAFTGGDPLRFKVGPKSKGEKFEHLPHETIEAVDASEAIRYYCVNHEFPKGSGRRVDPVIVRLQCVLLDERKLAGRLNHKRVIAAIRRKMEAGHGLTQREQDLFEEHEAEILNLKVET